MNVITGVLIIVAIIVCGLVAIYAVDAWRQVQFVKAKETIFDITKTNDSEE